ncbi:hypothetical protein GQ457_11G005580 [Hibiscus cannabinus]
MRNPLSEQTSTSNSKVGLKRGPWTPQEDQLLATYIKTQGEGRWRTLPKRAGLLRCGKSCRLRWMNYLRPSVKRGQITPDEEDLILRLHRLLGNRWSLIAGRIPGRTDNEIKNYWNSHLSKKLISQGIDPRTHKPLNHLKNPGPAPATIPNPAASSSGGQITAAGKENDCFPNHHQTEDAPTVHGFTGPPNGEGCGLEMRSSCSNQNQGITRSINEEDDEDIISCNDDVFSSFLNSLINEEALANQNPMQQLTNGAAQADNALVSIAAPSFGLAQDWNFNQG